MPFLKTHASHGKFARAFYYLHYGCRSASEVEALDEHPRRRDLGIDARGVSAIVDASMPSLNKWCDEMQSTYDLYEKTHKAPPRGRPRTFYHFVISPDPKDRAGLGQVRGLCNAWLDECFPGSEAAIVYHDDNSERGAAGLPGIVHGHVIVSAVLPGEGSKVQITDRRMDELTDKLQELSPAFGLSAFAHDESRGYKTKKHDPSRHERPQRCGAERAILARRGTSWKEDVRKMVSATLPFCTDFQDLRRHLAPYGYGAERIRGGLLFITPEGKKVGSNHLGFGFQEYRMARFFRKEHYSRASDLPRGSLADELAAKSKMLSRTNPGLVALQETLDALSVIRRENIRSMDDFSERRKELRSFGTAGRIDLARSRKAIDDAGDLLGHALALQAYDAVYRRYTELPVGPERTAFFAECGKEISANARAEQYLREKGLTKREALRMLDEYKPLAESYLNLQASVEGTARRLSDLKSAHYVAQRISSAFLMRENEERAALGMTPKMPPITKVKAPPKEYRDAKTPPYWNVNMKKEAYAKIRSANRRTRLNLARIEPDRHMPPYIERQGQIRTSMDAQRRADAAARAPEPRPSRTRQTQTQGGR